MLQSAIESVRPNARVAWSFAAAILSLLLVWFGVMAFFPFSGRELMAAYALDAETARQFGYAAGALQIVLGIALLRPWPQAVRSIAALLTAVFWWSTLVFLLTPAAWVQAAPYDGFPYIGNGQGVLKHLGLGALAFALWARWTQRSGALRFALWGLWAGQLLVIAWIGAIKFTQYEAEGVASLMRASPLFSWLYGLFDVRSASNVIGSIELVTAALIALWPWRPRAADLGLCMAAVTYVLTNTFLFTTPGWQPEYGAPFVGGTGQFLLKDLGLLAGALLLLSLPRNAATGRIEVTASGETC